MDKHIRDIIGKCEDEVDVPAPVLDMVIKDIFMSCDAENEGLVPVAKLIDFIIPFLQGNMHALEELQKSLDPNNANPRIDIDTFYKDMSEWTLKISSAEHPEDGDSHNETPRDFERFMDKDMSFLQSTPRSSFGRRLLKGYVESGISNLSIASSVHEHQSMYFPERTILEEQIQQLQHQNRQVTEELARVKVELTSVAEQNETLQSDMDKVLKKLANEQKLNAQMQSERKKEDDCEEELCCARKQVVKLERTIASLEKENGQLQQELDVVLTEKQDLECQIQRLDRKSEETKSSMMILQTEIDMRKSEVDSEHKNNEALVQHNQDLCDIIEKCIINIDRLKLEKAMMTKFFRERMSKGESLRGLNLNRAIRSNSFSEYAGISRKAMDRRRVSDATARYLPESRAKPFNSPKLLRMLREPVTPNLDAPPAKGNRRSSDINWATMLLNRRSTPHSNNQEPASLLDSTLPGALREMPALSPIHLCNGSPNAYSVGAEMLDLILERAMGTINEENHWDSYDTPPPNSDSPPVAYVMERTPYNEGADATAPPYSPKISDSSDMFSFYNYEMMSAVNETSTENLLDEMAKATVCEIDEESECEESTPDSKDKTDSGSRKTFISEVHMKLDEFIDLEQKCETLEQRIAELENENSLKDMRIFDLSKEIEKLRQQLTSADNDRVKELLDIIENLEREKNANEMEKRLLTEEIKVLNEEKAVLQLSKEELLKFERNSDNLKNLPEEIMSSSLLGKEKVAKDDLECLKIDYERIKSSMETYQKVNQSLNSQNRVLQKSMREKGKLLKDNIDEVVELRRASENLKGEVQTLRIRLDDSNRTISRLKNEVESKDRELEEGRQEILEKVGDFERITTSLKACEVERDRLRTTLEEVRKEARYSSDKLEKLKATEAELQQSFEEAKRRLEQEVKKQDYLGKKFIDLENELIQEKNSSAKFRESYDSLQEDIGKFKEALLKLEKQLTSMEEDNGRLTLNNAILTKACEDKNMEIQQLIEAKSFIAMRNEELLQENGEICQKFDVVSRELNAKISLLDGMKRKLGEIEQLRVENQRIKMQSEEILEKMRALDSEEAESDQVDAYRRESSFHRSREKRLGRKTGNNFERLMMRNAKLEEKNTILGEEVSELRQRLAKEVEEKHSVVSHTNTIRDILHERRIRLGRATQSTTDVWKQTLENYVNGAIFDDDLQPESPVLILTGPLDEEMWQLKHQIHQTTVLLSHLTCFMNRQMLRKNEFTQTDLEHSLSHYKIGEVSTASMEETFATLVLTYTVDKDLLHQRFHDQKVQLGETERLLGEAVSALTLYMEENSTNLNVTNYLNSIVQLCTQVSISAVQYGSLRQQTELTAAAEMMVNYVASLRQEIDSLAQQVPTIGPTTALNSLEYQPLNHLEQQCPADVENYQSYPRRFLSCVKTTCVMFTFSVFVLVVSLVLHTDVVFKGPRCPPPV